ncbi:MAG: glycosyltransferase family 1 protein [Candidatus Taylorbacteria bacterium]|nr:glycosyltransferase family 1 protein [Candidatus Taylorbacteria bacterium]
MKKILIFSLAYYPRFVGGAEVAIKEITDRLGSDFRFDMVTLRLDRRDLAYEKIGNVDVYRVGFGTTNYLNKIWYILGAYVKASSLHKKTKYDMSWAMMSYMGFPALFLKWIKRVPFVLTLQEGDSIEHIIKRKRIKIVSGLYKKVFKEASIVQVISNYLGDFARSMGYEGKIEMIPNGVDISRFKSQPRIQGNKIILITTSRLVEKNAVDDIINSLKYLPENVELMIAGIGLLEDRLKAQVRDEKLEERVKFLDYVSQENLPKCLQGADIFIRPSLSEGMGISFIEAMAAGIPVIATPVGGIVDFINDGETGLFCEVKNPKSIALKVEKLMKDKESRDYIVGNALKLVTERYDWNLITQDIKHRVFDILF